MKFTVRRAEERDLDELVAFTIAEAIESEGLERDSAVVRSGVEAGLSDSSIATYWVVESEEDGIVAGTSVVKEWSDWHAQDYWWIQSMYVRPDHRGRGIVESMIEAVAAEARSADAAELRLYVHRENRRAVSAYRRSGFSDTCYKIMSKSLRDGRDGER